MPEQENAGLGDPGGGVLSSRATQAYPGRAELSELEGSERSERPQGGKVPSLKEGASPLEGGWPYMVLPPLRSLGIFCF